MDQEGAKLLKLASGVFERVIFVRYIFEILKAKQRSWKYYKENESLDNSFSLSSRDSRECLYDKL